MQQSNRLHQMGARWEQWTASLLCCWKDWRFNLCGLNKDSGSDEAKHTKIILRTARLRWSNPIKGHNSWSKLRKPSFILIYTPDYMSVWFSKNVDQGQNQHEEICFAMLLRSYHVSVISNIWDQPFHTDLTPVAFCQLLIKIIPSCPRKSDSTDLRNITVFFY